jgi:hypothetical protein
VSKVRIIFEKFCRVRKTDFTSILKQEKKKIKKKKGEDGNVILKSIHDVIYKCKNTNNRNF